MAEQLAIDGGTPVRENPMPHRALFGNEEKEAVTALFNAAMERGEAFGYNGEPETNYEKAFVDFMGGGYADGVNSGTNALFCAIGGLQIDALSEIIVPPISDPGGVMPVLFAGCVPIVADAAPGSFNTGADQIAPLITDRTRAVIVAHIAGEPVDMDPVMKLAEKHDLFVIEDVAQAHGARYKGRLVGSIGHIAAFSTMHGKHHATGGQGGVVYTTDETLHWQAKRFADRGKPFNIDSSTNVVAGLNCNSNDLSATIGLVQIKKLPEIISSRRAVAGQIAEGLAESLCVKPGWVPADSEPVYWFMRMKYDDSVLGVDKARFCDALKAEGIPVNPSYRHIPCEQAWFKNKAVFGTSGYPWTATDYTGDRSPSFTVTNAVAATDQHFNIPLHERYGSQEAEDIVRAIVKVERAWGS